MKTKDCYIKFIENINNRITYYSEELHFTIGMCGIFSNAIMKSDNKDVVNYFSKHKFLSQFSLNDLKDFEISIELLATIKNYHRYVSWKLVYLHIMLENYSCISSIPYIEFYDIITSYNNEISKLILNGDTITLSRIGSLKIACKPKKYNKTILDNNKTKENKKYFEEHNIEGDYRVYNNNTEYLIWIYTRFGTTVNLDYYHFSPTNYNNMVDRKIENYYNLKKSNNDIIDNIKIGNVQKMNALINNDVKYKLRYIQNAS